MKTPSDTPVTNPIFSSAFKVGAVAGAAGMIVGGANTILRGSTTVGLFSVLTGVNSALLGGTYWAVRESMVRALQDPETPIMHPKEKVYVSGTAGAVSGSFVALALGIDPPPYGRYEIPKFGCKPRSVFPGALVWGLIGISGQSLYNFADSHHTNSVIQEREKATPLGFWDRAMRSKWSPVTRLTTEEYENMLKQKLLVVEADLAITNEEIARLERMKLGQQAIESPEK